MIDTNELAEKASKIIFNNEGNYTTVTMNDNGALSIGKIQWHGDRALELMKRIVRKLGDSAVWYLGKSLVDEVGFSSDWSKRIVTPAEKSYLEKALATVASKDVQDLQAVIDIEKELETGQRSGLVDEPALIYFADFANQYGTYSTLLKSITQQAIQIDGGTIESMYKVTIDKTSNYLDRRKRVYDAVKLLYGLNFNYSKKQFVMDVQKATGSSVDGIAGKETLSNTVTVSRYKNTKHCVVLPVQKYLKFLGYYTDKPNGTFNLNTENAVKVYQRVVVKQTNPDGEITARQSTWKSLLGL